MEEETNFVSIRDLILKTLKEARGAIDEEVCVQITDSLANISQQPFHYQIQSLVEVLDILQGYASFREILIRNVQPMTTGESSSKSALIRKLIEPIFPVESIGSLYYCPVDPTHYRRRINKIEEPPICPLHKVELVQEK